MKIRQTDSLFSVKHNASKNYFYVLFQKLSDEVLKIFDEENRDYLLDSKGKYLEYNMYTIDMSLPIDSGHILEMLQV